MEVIPILDDLILFQSYAKDIDLTFNQYLLAGKQPLLVHTRDRQLAGQLAEHLVPALQGVPLSYIFISHFESDECGALAFWLDRFPEARGALQKTLKKLPVASVAPGHGPVLKIPR